MKSLAIVQARMTSQRLPGKVMKLLQGKPVLWHIVQRLRHVPGLTQIVVATSSESADLPIRNFCEQNDISIFLGSEDDVLDRYYQTAKSFRGDPIVRITADCPLIDPKIVQRLLDLFASDRYDYVAVATGAGTLHDFKGNKFPDGLDAECFSIACLEKAWKEATDPLDREHVTSYLWRRPKQFRAYLLAAENDHADQRWTLDNEMDLKLITQIYQALYRDDTVFSMQDVLNFLKLHPELSEINRSNIGAEKYQELWPSQN